MKKAACLVISLLACTLCSSVYGEVVIDNTSFPDEAFRKYVRNFDVDSDGVLSDAELAAVNTISAGGYAGISNVDSQGNAYAYSRPVYESRYKINSLNGIENFTGLQILDCSFNNLEELDLSSFPELVYLNCADNNLTSLDISHNPKLKVLWCCMNSISSLNTRNNPELKALYCWTNELSELDVSNNTQLEVLFCSGNRLTALDTSKNVKLWSLSCSKNKLRGLDISSNPSLIELYCFENNLSKADINSNPGLTRLSLTGNNLGSLNISSNVLLKAVDCGRTYLASLDVSRNTVLEELYVYESPIRNIDLSANTALISLDCMDNNLLTLDLSKNTLLRKAKCYGNSKLETLHLTSSDGHYQTDIREYVGADIGRVRTVEGYRYEIRDGDSYSTSVRIGTSFSGGTAVFETMPHIIYYGYATLYSGSSPSNNVPEIMNIKVSLPRDSFIYIPSPTEPEEQASSYVVSIDETADFYSFMTASIPDTVKEPAPVRTDNTSSNNSGSGGGGGGCNSGLGIVSLMLCGLLLLRRKRGVFVLAALLTASAFYPAHAATVKTADYVLPIEYTIYDIAGTWTADFELTPELTEKIASEWVNPAVSENTLSASEASLNIHLYSKAVLAEGWEVRPQDLYTLSMTGEYGGIILPVIEGNTSNDIYVALCTFSSDIQPGELISVHGFQVDTSERESVSEEGKRYVARFVVLDEDYKRVDSVPESRKVYIAVSLSPEYINAGIVTVIRGEYMTEDEPLYRLTPEAAQNIADELGIASTDLKYLTRANIGLPVEPTEAMKEYVKSDDHEIIINLPTISVDEQGTYVIPITLSDDEFELLRGKSVSDFKTYALNDSDLGDDQMRQAFIIGLINTWEVYTLTGTKMDTFGVKEFLLVGMLNAGKPFSLYVAKMLLMLLAGGCSSGIIPSAVAVIIAGTFIIKHRRH